MNSVQEGASQALLIVVIVIMAVAALVVWGALIGGMIEGLLDPLTWITGPIVALVAGLIIAAIWGSLAWAFGGAIIAFFVVALMWGMN